MKRGEFYVTIEQIRAIFAYNRGAIENLAALIRFAAERADELSRWESEGGAL